MRALRQPIANDNRGVLTVDAVDVRILGQNRYTSPSAAADHDQMATDREYVDLKLEASEARAETRFVELNGKLDRLIEIAGSTRADLDLVRTEVRNDYRSTRAAVVITGISIFLALSALLLAVMTYGDAIFSRGMSVRDVVNSAVKEQADRASNTRPPADK